MTALAAGAGFWWLSRDRDTATREIDPADLAKAPPLGDMALGSANAPVTIIEYASMTCPHCAEFHRTVFPELKAQYINTGTVRFIFREFPIDPVAATCSMLARCIGKDDPTRYHAAIDALFATQDKWMANDTEGSVAEHRQAGRHERRRLQRLHDRPAPAHGPAAVPGSRLYEAEGGSTPTFFVNGKRMVGARPFEDIHQPDRNEPESVRIKTLSTTRRKFNTALFAVAVPPCR